MTQFLYHQFWNRVSHVLVMLLFICSDHELMIENRQETFKHVSFYRCFFLFSKLAIWVETFLVCHGRKINKIEKVVSEGLARMQMRWAPRYRAETMWPGWWSERFLWGNLRSLASLAEGCACVCIFEWAEKKKKWFDTWHDITEEESWSSACMHS